MLTPLRRLVLSGLLVLALQPAAPVWAACDCGESPEVCCLAGTVQVAPEALALATVSLADIAAVLPDAHSWWAYRPEYNLGLAERLPGELYYVAQRYRQIDTQGELVSTLVLYGDEHQASDAFATALAAERGEPAEGPAVAEERGYRQAEGYPNVLTTLRFRAGRVMGRLTSTGDQPLSTGQLAHLLTAALARLPEVLAGRAVVPALPAQLAALLPPARAAAAVGPVAGTGLLPVTAWALDDRSGTPREVAAYLHELGARQLPFRRYLACDLPGHVVEVTLFPVRSPAAASLWLRTFLDGPAPLTLLNAGKVGPRAYYSYADSAYDLQFAKGRYAVDVIGYAPFGAVEPAMQGIVRRLAEAWYRALPAD